MTDSHDEYDDASQRTLGLLSSKYFFTVQVMLISIRCGIHVDLTVCASGQDVHMLEQKLNEAISITQHLNC